MRLDGYFQPTKRTQQEKEEFEYILQCHIELGEADTNLGKRKHERASAVSGLVSNLLTLKYPCLSRSCFHEEALTDKAF
jgi:hypothetical protein